MFVVSRRTVTDDLQILRTMRLAVASRLVLRGSTRRANLGMTRRTRDLPMATLAIVQLHYITRSDATDLYELPTSSPNHLHPSRMRSLISYRTGHTVRFAVSCKLSCSYSLPCFSFDFFLVPQKFSLALHPQLLLVSRVVWLVGFPE
jgi:hypothetical protein